MTDHLKASTHQRLKSLRQLLLNSSWTPFLLLLSAVIIIIGCESDSENSQTASAVSKPAQQTMPEPEAFWIHNKTAQQPVPVGNRYAGSQSCKKCHASIYQKYMNHPMAHSIHKLGEQVPQEDYTEKTQFDAGGYNYEIHSAGNHEHPAPATVHHIERLVMANGKTVLEQSIPMHYVVGSGSRGRSFLQHKGERLFQSPITWYVEKAMWDLSPGYMPANHQRFEREILDRCISCHAGMVNRIGNKPHHFDAQVPFREMGISCERCHGPADKHVQGHRDQTIQADQFIVNPATLPTIEKESICNQCHLSGKLRVERFGRTFYDFRPGMKLDEAWTVFTSPRVFHEDGSAQILSHVEQMMASECYQSSRTEMSCTSCHDPHSTPLKSDKQAFYRQKCLQCHTTPQQRCSVPLLQRQQKADNSCYACHMPRIPNSDIAHSTQSDHRVLRNPQPVQADNSLTVMKKHLDRTPWVLFQDADQRMPQWEIDRAQGEALMSQFATVKDKRLLQLAEAKLEMAARTISNDSHVLRNLGRVYYLQNNIPLATEALKRARELDPQDAIAISLLALCYSQQKDYPQGIALYPDWQAQSHHPSMEYGLFAEMFYHEGNYRKAIHLFQESLTLNPTLTLHHRSLSAIQSRHGAAMESQQNLQQAALIESLIQPYLPVAPVTQP